MSRINVPSAEFWTVTPFSIDVPDGWLARQTADHLVYMHAADDEQTNCSVRWSRVAGDLGLVQIAQMSLANVRRVDPQVRVGLSLTGKLHGVKGYTRVCEYALESGRRTGQSYFAIFGPRFGEKQPVELFEITGHFPAGDQERLAQLEAITTSFHFALQPRPISSPADLEQRGA